MASFQVADSLATAIYNKIKTAIFNSVYPVGSIYLSCDTTNPSTKFGGTWTRLTGGFIYGSVVTTSNTNTNSTGNIGSGTNTNDHTLTVNEIPSHDHEFPDRMMVWDAGTNKSDAVQDSIWNSSLQFRPWGTKIGKTGGGAGHSHPIPYIACSIWKRTA